MKITAAFVLQGQGADHVILHTDLPSPMPLVSSQPLAVTFPVEYRKGPEYVREHFGIEPTIRQN